MSPILGAFGGAIEKIYTCDNCRKERVAVENFVSLNFEKLNIEEVETVRKNFLERNYKEGMVYKSIPLEKRSFKNKLLLQSSQKVLQLTIRDYLCHLNFTRNDNMELCRSCGEKQAHILFYTLFRLPKVLSIGFAEQIHSDQVIAINEAEKAEENSIEFLIEPELNLNIFVKEVTQIMT